MRLPVTVLAAVLMSAGCRYQPEIVPMAGSRSAIAALAGTWEGSFTGDENGRLGTIAFIIRAGSDTAYGDVAMFPRLGSPAMPMDHASAVPRGQPAAPHMLRVAFVYVSRDVVEGTLEPYLAPDCECVVRTTFSGVVDGDRIAGRFVTLMPDGTSQRGEWLIRRERR